MRLHRFVPFVLVLVLIAAGAGCGGTDPSLGPLDLTETELGEFEDYFAPIHEEADTFDRLRASEDQSPEAVRSFVEAVYSPNVVFHDETFNDHREGYEQVVTMYEVFLFDLAGAQKSDRPVLIGDETALQVIPLWDMTLGSWRFTETEPLVEVDLIELDDGRVGSLLLFYDLASLRRIRGDRPHSDGSIQEGYAAAWSSESTEAVAAIYSSEATRHDGLASVDVVGSVAISAEADRWFEAIPGATWGWELGFGEVSGQRAGAVFEVQQDGCTVTVGTFWDLDENGLITHELIHYDPATLRACGWVK